MKKTKKIYSKTMANSSLAMCYIEECVNKPTEKRFIFYLWDRKNKWYNSRTLIMDEALLVNHLMYNNPQMLQKLLDECTLYGFVKRRVKEYCNAVDQQTEKLCKADKEMQLALAQGNTEQYAELEKTIGSERKKCQSLFFTLHNSQFTDIEKATHKNRVAFSYALKYEVVTA